MSFLKQMFTWWHRQTFGTFFYTLFMGRFVGDDELGTDFSELLPAEAAGCRLSPGVFV